MKDFLRRRGPTIVVAALMFVAGGATVTTAQNMITGADIKNGSIKTANLARNAVTSAKIANGSIKTADLANSAVTSAKIANGGVANTDLANNAVNSAKIHDGSVTGADVAHNSITGTDVNESSLGEVPSAANAGTVDGLDANHLTRVNRMGTVDTELLPTDGGEVTYGSALSITAPRAGFVMIHGSTTVISFGCTAGCYFYAQVHHNQTDAYSTIAMGSLYSEVLANTSHAYVFPVDAGVNTFNIVLSRGPGDGELDGWYGELSAVFSPFGPAGGTFSATAATEVASVPTVDEPKPIPGG